jgi:hypothetical protein
MELDHKERDYTRCIRRPPRAVPRRMTPSRPRRTFVATCLGAAALPAFAARGEAPVGAGDVAVLNAMLAIELETLAAYRRAASCGLLAPARQDLAARCAADHRAHRELLVATIRALGGVPAEVPGAHPDDAVALAREADALDLAARCERFAASAYVRMVPALRDRALAKLAARVAADEAMHWGMVNAALGRPPPGAALSFGA